jgi:hypothetical protein
MVPTNSTNIDTTEIDMELLAIIVTVLGSLVLLDVAALRKGSDSRDRIGDDWHRSTIA